MKKRLRYYLLLIILAAPAFTYAGWPVGKYRNLVVPAFNYYTAKDSWDKNGKKIKGVAGNGFDSYALNLFYSRGLTRRLDVVISLPVVYQVSRYAGGSSEGYGPTDLTAGLVYNLINSRYERFFSVTASAIAPLYDKNNARTAVGYGSFGTEAKLSFSGNIPKRLIKGCYFNTEVYYRRYFDQDGPNHFGLYGFLGFQLSRSNQITVDAIAIKSVSLNKTFDQNITSIKDYSLIKPSLNFGHRFGRRFSLFAGGFYTVAGRNTAIGYGSNISGSSIYNFNYNKVKNKACFLILIFWFASGITATVFAQNDGDSDTGTGEVIIKAIPGKKNAIFKKGEDINYKLKISNLYGIIQEGQISCRVRTDLGIKVFERSQKFSIGKNESKTVTLTVPAQKAGFYNIDFRLNLTEYDDTVRRVFGVDPETLMSPSTKPADFDAFWGKTRRELNKIKPDYKITLQKELSDANRKVYLVEMRSYGNLLIRGWLVIPKEGYKQPVHYRLPGYVVGLNPNFDNNHFITFNLNVRGNGNSQDVVNLSTEDYIYTGIESKDTYIYKGVYMDCLRGADFLFSHPELGMDTSKIYVEGSSQGGALAVVTAAMDKRIKLLALQVPLYSDFRLDKEVGLKYDVPEFPVKSFTRYINNNYNASWGKIFATMDYYDPQNFAPMVKCPVIMGIGLLDKFCPPRCSFSLFNHLGSKNKEWYASPELTHEVAFDYYMLQNVWLGENFRLVY